MQVFLDIVPNSRDFSRKMLEFDYIVNSFDISCVGDFDYSKSCTGGWTGDEQNESPLSLRNYFILSFLNIFPLNNLDPQVICG